MATLQTGNSIANHPLYASIREQLPGVPEDKTVEITLRALQGGILSPDGLQRAQVHQERIVAVGTVPGFGAMVDLNTPAPPAAELDVEYAALAPISPAAPTPEAPALATPRVNVRIDRELKPEERTALAQLDASIQATTRTLGAIPAVARMTLADGRSVSGSELREMWSKTEFAIHDTGYNGYRNKSARGEADFNGGEPRIAFNIDVVERYGHPLGGMNYLVLHEIGHMTSAGRETNEQVYRDKVLTAEENRINERLANDVARGIANHGRLDVLARDDSKENPTLADYSAETPTFQTPAPPLEEGGRAPRR